MGSPLRVRQTLVENSRLTFFRALSGDSREVLVRLDRTGELQVGRLEQEFAHFQQLRDTRLLQPLELIRMGQSYGLLFEDCGELPLRAALPNELDCAAFLSLALRMCNALLVLHEMGFIHGTLDPSCFFVHTRSGVTKLGVLSSIGPPGDLSLHGTPPDSVLAYAAPERTGRLQSHICVATDLYSLGAIFYELLTGTIPFIADEPAQMMHAHLTRLPVPVDHRRPEIPGAVAQIVGRLLAKQASDRYTSCQSLIEDLRFCSMHIHEYGDIPDTFVPGQRHSTGVLREPQILHGREIELQHLLRAVQACRQGARRVVVIEGDAGSGKSSLLQHLHEPVIACGGRYLEARFTALHADASLATLLTAIAGLVDEALTRSEGHLAALRERLRAGLGEGLAVLCQAIPHLNRVVGEPQQVASVPGPEAKSQLEILLLHLLELFSEPGRPIILALDDLQWADAGSRSLLHAMARDQRLTGWMIVATVRSEDLATPGLAQELVKTFTSDVETERLQLPPLDPMALHALVCEALSETSPTTRELANELLRQSHGNPLFATRYLRHLYDSGNLVYTHLSGWQFSHQGGTVLPDDLAILIESELERLPGPALQLAMVAACLDQEINLAFLEKLMRTTEVLEVCPGYDPSTVSRDTTVLLQSGLWSAAKVAGHVQLVQLVQQIQLVQFVHERLRQAAYCRWPAATTGRLHRTIGRLQLREVGEHPCATKLPVLLRHLNASLELPASAGFWLQLTRLNLRAAKLARRATAHEAATSYLKIACTIISREHPPTPPELAYEVHEQFAYCSYLAGDLANAEASFTWLLEHAPSALERARTLAMVLQLRMTRGQTSAALQAGLDGLDCLGIKLPRDPATWPVRAREVGAQVRLQLTHTRVADLLDRDPCVDAHKRMAIELLAYLMIPAGGTPLFELLIVLQVQLALEHGPTEVTPFGLAVYGFLTAVIHGNFAEAQELGLLAHTILKTVKRGELACRIAFALSQYVGFYQPLNVACELLDFGRTHGLSSGNFLHAAFSSTHGLLFAFARGRPLAELEQAIDDSLGWMWRLRVESSRAAQHLLGQYIRSLMGKTTALGELSDPEGGFEEQAFLAQCRDKGFGFVACQYAILMARMALLIGDYEAGLRHIEVADSRRAWFLGFFFTIELPYLEGLLLARARPHDVAEIERCHAQVTQWHQLQNGHFSHRYHHLYAELARLRGDTVAAMEHYDLAIECAQACGWQGDAALILESTGQFYRAQRRTRIANMYTHDAYHAYDAWGAAAKAKQIADTFKDLELAPKQPMIAAARPEPSLELRAVLRATQALSAETQMANLMDKVMMLAVESAGADRGILILEQGGMLMLQAEFSTRGGLPTPEVWPCMLSESCALLAAPVRFSHRVGELVVIDDALASPAYAHISYVLQHRPRSVLCIPLKYQGACTGVLYLENSVTAGAFTKAHQEVLEVLGTHAAITLNNALAYARVQTAREAAEAASRTKSAFLANMSHELRTPLNAIIGYSALLTELAEDAGVPDFGEDLERINLAGNHLLGIISDILDLSKIEAGKLDIRRRRFAIDDIVREVEATVRPLAQQGCNTLQIETGNELGSMETDPTRLRQVLINLLGNASKFTRNGEIVFAVEDHGARVAFRVTDTGIGMSQQQQKHIFEAFHQVDGSSTKEYGGTGLGLTITRHLCEMLGGELHVESQLGVGSTFRAILPRRLPSQRHTPTTTPDAPTSVWEH